jgi:phage-related protein
MPLQAVFYRDPDGNEPVLDVLNALPDRKRVVLENQLDRLNMQEPEGPPLPQPWTSQIEGELREFRAHYGEEHYRVLYRRSGSLLILLHLIRKTTGSVPKRTSQLRRSAGPISSDGWTPPRANRPGPPGMTRPEAG